MELPLLQQPAVKNSNPKASLGHSDLSSGKGQAEQTGTGKNREFLQAKMAECGEGAVMTGKVLLAEVPKPYSMVSSVLWTALYSHGVNSTAFTPLQSPKGNTLEE